MYVPHRHLHFLTSLQLASFCYLWPKTFGLEVFTIALLSTSNCVYIVLTPIGSLVRWRPNSQINNTCTCMPQKCFVLAMLVKVVGNLFLWRGLFGPNLPVYMALVNCTTCPRFIWTIATLQAFVCDIYYLIIWLKSMPNVQYGWL